jgi:hypothetical protein
MISPRLREIARATYWIDARDPVSTQVLPVRLRSRANEAIASLRGRRGQASRSKTQRGAARMALAQSRLEPGGRAIVRLVRISPRELDGDNLAAALKAVRDGVADALGVNDRDPRVTWLPDWERGAPRQHAVRVEVYR